MTLHCDLSTGTRKNSARVSCSCASVPERRQLHAARARGTVTSASRLFHSSGCWHARGYDHSCWCRSRCAVCRPEKMLVWRRALFALRAPSGALSPVVIVSGFDGTKVQPYHLFILFGLYGDVVSMVAS